MAGMVLYGDFTCPWSHLAFRRAQVLRADGPAVEWRAVEHHPWVPGTGAAPDVVTLKGEVEQVAELLLPGEDLPADWSAITTVPRTRFAVTAAAEAAGAGVGASAAQLIFEAYWSRGFNIADPRALRSMLVDVIRSGDSDSEILNHWGYCLDVTGGAVTAAGWRLAHEWASGWAATATSTVPLLAETDGTVTQVGVDAVKWLGSEIERRGLDPRPTPVDPHAAVRSAVHVKDLPPTQWATQIGGAWIPRSQTARAIAASAA